MAAEGLQTLAPVEPSAFIGLGGLVRHLPDLAAHPRDRERRRSQQPDALVIIDSPDFTHRVARACASPRRDPDRQLRAAFGVGLAAVAARAMRPYVDRGAGDPAVRAGGVRAARGPPCTYVGHPLAERIGDCAPEAGEARRRADPPLVLVLPGSRGSEIRRLAAIFGAAIANAARARRAVRLVLPTLPHIAAQVARRDRGLAGRPRIVVERAEKYAAFRSARAALAASGR